MDYQQSREYIKDAEKYGSVLGLENMQEMMERLGNPQDDLHFVHVAGTNGKGSVIAYLYTVLSGAGYRVGRYISPAIYSYRERMETAGEPVSREKFAEYLTKVARVIQEMTEQGLSHPTPFEIETAVAFLFFKDENCDLVLLEVGMGGGLDATNIIKSPVLSVITPVSMDHMSFLGNTLGEIAEKKAGIIKTGCAMVTARQQPEAESSIRRACERCGVPYVVADNVESDNDVPAKDASLLGQSFCCRGERYEISLAGVYQKDNALLALKALEILNEKGFLTSLEQRKAGLVEARWGGRFSVIHRNPLFVVDGAHNPAAADMLVSSIRHYFQGKKIYYIMGMFHDKDYRSVIAKTVPFAERIITIAAPGNPRALPAPELARAVEEIIDDTKNSVQTTETRAGTESSVQTAGTRGGAESIVAAAETLEEAVERAFAMAGPEDVILAFGSLAFIGPLTRIVDRRSKSEQRTVEHRREGDGND
ncbi:bifunctional folylpolyglutamate synthase/dihydrofolate synthase [Blautia schinkii]|nr:bifunctional folylpolyglutamate synthase/dihydrofolate synthase [Blautia schinkii]